MCLYGRNHDCVELIQRFEAIVCHIRHNNWFKARLCFFHLRFHETFEYLSLNYVQNHYIFGGVAAICVVFVSLLPFIFLAWGCFKITSSTSWSMCSLYYVNICTFIWSFILFVWLVNRCHFLLFSGWHQCSICEKNVHYMCYTCTFSLCKGCVKDNVILCVRGNKGFCETCMKTVMLIENDEQGNKEV